MEQLSSNTIFLLDDFHSPALGEDLHEVVGQVASGQVETQNGVRKSVTLVDGDSVGDAVAGIEDDAGGATGSVKRQNSLNRDVHGGGVESLKHDLRHLFSVGFGVERSFGEEDGMLFGRNSQLVVEGVMPDLFHVVPVGNDSMLDGVLQGKDTSLGLSLVADVRVLLTHAD